MAGQTVFEHIVRGVLNNAIPVNLERSLDLKMGSILVYQQKPSIFKPWRKHHLVFTGVGVENILNGSVDMQSTEEVLYDDANYSRTISEDVKLDADIKSSLVDFGMNFDVGETKVLTGDFGKVTRIVWKLREDIMNGKFQGTLNMDHPVVKDAKTHGSTIFVVTHLYRADKVVIALTRSIKAGGGADDKPVDGDTTGDPTGDPTGDTTGDSGSGTATGKSVSDDSKDDGSITTKTGIQRNSPTYIAMLVLAFTFDNHGRLSMKFRTDLSEADIRYLDEVDFGGTGIPVSYESEKEKKVVSSGSEDPADKPKEETEEEPSKTEEEPSKIEEDEPSTKDKGQEDS